MRGIFKKIVQEIREYVFPDFCFWCEKEGRVCCEDCSQILGAACTVQSVQVQEYRLCFLSSYSGVMERAIWVLKFLHNLEILYHISFSDVAACLDTVDMVVPVPLHRSREAERGFNQAQIIAVKLVDGTGIPVVPLITRKKKTKQQALLRRKQRQTNVADAFVVSEKFRGYECKKILLVDDVYTTGATMLEAAKVLREWNTGVEIVFFCLARSGG